MFPTTIHAYSFKGFPEPSAIYLDAIHLGLSLRVDSLLPLENPGYLDPNNGTHPIPPHRKKPKYLPDLPLLKSLTSRCFHDAKFRVSLQNGYLSVGGSARRLQTNGALLFRRIADLPDPPATTEQQKKNLNHLRPHEKELLIQRASALGMQPWKWQLHFLIERLSDVYCQMHEFVESRFPRKLIADQVIPEPLKLPLLQFYFEHPITPGRLPEVLEQITRGIAPLLGYYHVEKISNPAWSPDDAIRRWKIQIRVTDDCPRKKKEAAFLVVYVKNQDTLRIELSYEHPSIPEIRPDIFNSPEMPEFKTVLWRIAEEAVERLRLIQANLNLPAVQVSARELFEALTGYDLQKVTRDIGWRNFVSQVAETGCYDPACAPPELLPGEKFILDYRARRRISDPHTGMFHHVRKNAFNGPGTKFVYVLRPDWKDGPSRFADCRKVLDPSARAD